MTRLRGLIIDDNRTRRDSIKSILPEYIDCEAVGAGEGALGHIKRDAGGALPDFVILNGDDPKNFGLYVFDWMINKSNDPDIEAIPVIVLTEDEFSDRCMEFLEVGDVIFYEGEIDESELFSVINDAIEEAEFAPDVIEPVFEETKNIDRLMGQSVKAPANTGQQRSIVIDMNERVVNLEAALERGRKRVEQIRTLMDAAANAQEAEDELDFRRKKKTAKDNADQYRMSSFLQKARENANVEEQILESMKKRQEAARSGGRVLKRDEHAQDPSAQAADTIGRLRQKAMTDPLGAFSAQGTIRVEERSKVAPQASVPNDKKTVVIVDDDLKTRKLCSLFLTQKYNVYVYDSGIKCVDHFIKSSADLLIINPVLGGMDGRLTVSSIRMHPGGRNVPVMFLVGDNYMQSRASLLGPLVVGILNKPVKQGTLSQSVDGFFENLRRARQGV